MLDCRRIPPLVEPVIAEYLRLVEEQLPDFLAAFYLHGSLALDAFNPRSSDIDFVAVIARRCSPEEVDCLGQIHAAVARMQPHWEMSGIYLQWEDLGRPASEIPLSPVYDDEALDATSHHELNIVTWWILKNKGIAVVGPEPSALAFTVDDAKLIAYMRENLSTYWTNFTCKPKRIAWLLTDFGIQWCVLGVLRQYYTLRENDITSKTGAGNYALAHLPARWHPLIREAIRIREHPDTATTYRFRLFRALDAWVYLRYVIQICSR